MKLINKQTIIAALVGGVSTLALTLGGVAFAHGGGPHGDPHGRGGPFSEQRMDERLSEMVERLGLSSDQERQIRAIAEGAKAEAEEIKEMPRGKEKMVAFRDLHFATEDQIYANLSCEQREELRLLKREHKVERMEQRFEQRHGPDSNQ